jgi:hypothetical protein
MWLRYISALAQLVIITLAILMMVQITKERVYYGALNDLDKRITERMDSDRAYFEGKINRIDNSLMNYQNTREQRVVLYNERLKNLEDSLEKKGK